MRGAQREPRFRHATAGRRSHCQRDAEIGHHRPTVVQQDVLRLDVSVDHAVRVRVVQCTGHIAGNAHGFVHAELRFAIESRSQRLTVDERHHVVQKSIRFAGIEQRHYVRMLQCRRGRDFLHESLGAKHGGELRFQHLHRDAPFVLDILGEIDRRHPALPKLSLNAIAVGQ